MKHTASFTNSARFKCLEDLQREAMELCLTYCGLEHCDPSHRFGPNKRSSYVLHIVRAGKGTLEINHRVYHLQRGDSFLIPPDVEAWYEADKKDPWFYMWVGFTGLKAEQCASRAGFSLKYPVHKVECRKTLYRYIEQMLEAHQLTYSDELKRNGFLMLFFSAIIKDYEERNPIANTQYPYPGSVYVKHSIEYIASNYEKKIKISELADYIGVNRSYLTNSFKKTIGCSPQEYLVNYRMQKAKSMLKSSDMQISEIAALVGYTDPLAFSKIFKQRYNLSPRAYREEKVEMLLNSRKGEHKAQRL